VTTLRADIATDGRHATVAFTRDFAIDAARRDFTVNALSVTAQGDVFDYGSGLADLAERRIRFFGAAEQRVREDYLRILRFYRFTAFYSNGLTDAEGDAACARLQSGMDILSAERVGAEMLKLLAAPAGGLVAVIERMQANGVLARALGGESNPIALTRLMALESVVPPDPIRRLMALALRAASDVERLRGRLRLTNAQAERMKGALAAAGSGLSPGALAADFYRHGVQAVSDAVLHRAARGDAAAAEIAATVLRDASSYHRPTLPIRSGDLIAAGLAAGPVLGRALREAEARWIAAGFPTDEAAIAAIRAASVAAFTDAQP
jgi:poly(A) polymerase